MATKNWAEIAKAGNEQLRMNLITAQGEIADGLAMGFPQYFLADGEEHPKPSRADFVRLVSDIDRRDVVVQACKDAGLPYQMFSFRGSCSGNTDGVSYTQGGYSTVRYGWLANFYRSSKRRGGELEYEGASWLVVWNGYGAGSAEWPSSHSLIILPLEALA